MMGAAGDDEIADALRADLALTVVDARSAGAIARIARELGRTATIHLKADTGMGRQGLPSEALADVARAIRSHAELYFEGAYSHLARGDDDREATRRQTRRFRDFAMSLDPRPPLLHLANSGGALIEECRFDMARIGIALYGGTPLYPECVPAMSVFGRIVHARVFAPGETVSYGMTYRAERKMRIGVVGVGYGEGYPRALSNAGWTLTHGRRCPIVGTICMDQFMIDLTAAPHAQPGDLALLFGRDNGSTLPAWELAAAAGTISYELMTVIGRLAGPERTWVE
ncbi:MAG: Alanine racemase 1 [candidate division BRC1 bacterium ADurb.BinA364]|nr:MAG: Alanine racemase 1 [candidate division BRC1 bacterium ADurb.BinA364]